MEIFSLKISAIVAISDNKVIGTGNKLPWHLPADLRFFKKNTSGHAIIMGRKTFESIGKPLPNRTNIVISRNPDYKINDCFVTGNIDTAFRYAVGQGHSKVFIIGGAEIFKKYLSLCDELILTEVHTSIYTDDAVFLNEINMVEWREKWSEMHHKDNVNTFDMSFRIFERTICADKKNGLNKKW